ncbi:uncharacterized protein LOC117647138 isoform X2 [Thrips palmi]|uniref:Uncharacterized protein LOC117647138 isoform X2 n=1 Tax=Thrips palmi TaxID=161013 RepID=A0A6P8YWS0_THRPL|nr:uncharacterized protein LOC117647138 isoform X2 [Thrips palmi]
MHQAFHQSVLFAKMELDSLCDDALLQVLRYLSPAELLACRCVCTRWRDLALDPFVWQDKGLTAVFKGERDERYFGVCCQLVAATLRLAPCLRYLCVGADGLHMDFLGVLLATTNCAVSSLGMTCNPIDAPLWSVVLSRQAALGRLKHVELWVKSDTEEKSHLCRLRQLLDQLVHTQGLKSLEMRVDIRPESFRNAPRPLKAAQLDAKVTASLRELMYLSRTAFVDPYLPLLLERHAATLEVVRLDVQHPRAAALLAGAARLRELRCPLLEGMPALLRCTALTSLSLVVGEDRAPLPAVKEYLRSAVARLESLVLIYPYDEDRDEDADVVLSLAGTGRAAPALRSLSFVFTAGLDEECLAHSMPQLRPLTAVLPRLQHLTRLSFNGLLLRSDFLDALDGQVLPDLEELRFDMDAPCPHQWAHGEQVRRLLQRYPRLHLCGYSVHDDDSLLCEYCKQHDCHWFEYMSCVLFSHAVEDSCGVDHSKSEVQMRVSLEAPPLGEAPPL